MLLDQGKAIAFHDICNRIFKSGVNGTESLCSKARAHKTDKQHIYTPKPDGWQKAWHTTPCLSQPKTDCSHSQNEEAKTAGCNLAQDLWRMKQARFWGKRSHLNNWLLKSTKDASKTSSSPIKRNPRDIRRIQKLIFVAVRVTHEWTWPDHTDTNLGAYKYVDARVRSMRK